MKWLFIFLFSTSLMATVKTTAKPTTAQIVSEFYTNLLKQGSEKHPPEQCNPRPDQGSCLKEFCSRMSTWECDDPTEIQNVTRACSGNFGNACLARACDQLPSFQRDDFDELSEITTACRNVYGFECFNFYAGKVDRYEMDDRAEVIEVINQCKGVSRTVLDCAQFTCTRAGSFKCDDVEEVTEILKACGK